MSNNEGQHTNRSNSRSPTMGVASARAQRELQPKSILTNNYLPPRGFQTYKGQEDEIHSANSGPPGAHGLQQPEIISISSANVEDRQYKRENSYVQQRVSTMPNRGARSSSTNQEWRSSEPLQNDPYQPSLVNDLLQGKNEWKNIQDIVKLTFKAVCDTVKSQGQAIRELEKQMMQKASSTELTANLQLKANVSDVSRAIAEIQSSLDQKQSFEDLNRFLDDKVSRQDLQYMLSNKVSVEELSRVLLTKSNIHEVNMEFG